MIIQMHMTTYIRMTVYMHTYKHTTVYMHMSICMHIQTMYMYTYTLKRLCICIKLCAFTWQYTCTWLYIHMPQESIYAHDYTYTWQYTSTRLCIHMTHGIIHMHMSIYTYVSTPLACFCLPQGPLHTFTIEQLRKIFNNTLVPTANPVRENSLGVGLRHSHISKSTKVVLTHSQDGFQMTVPYVCFYSRTHWWHACCLLSNTQPVDTYSHEMLRMWLVLTENAYKRNRFSRP